MPQSVTHTSLLTKLRSYLGSLRVVLDKTPVSFVHLVPRESPRAEKHCVILHGWAANGASMHAIAGALRALPAGADRHFWIANYDTTWTPLDASAKLLVRALQRQPHDFSDTLLIGYSMGGVVARRMVVEGFPCRDLIALCAPHRGTAWWVPEALFGPFLRGPHSLHGQSRALTALNRHPRDRARRDSYHFLAMTYDDVLGSHDHDGIVTRESALGEGLGPVASRQTMRLEYSRFATFDSHWRCMFPDYIPEFVATAQALMESGDKKSGSR
jgi:pimeloyl-ACP methyl ester carboxylesterase